MGSSWSPLLDGDLAAEALAAVEAVAGALPRAPIEPPANLNSVTPTTTG